MRRRSGVELNFDGLTDSVTNLVGSLILLVVLVVAVTSPKTAGLDRLPAPENEVGSDQAVDQLLDKIRIVGAKVKQVDLDITQMEQRIPEIAAELEELRQISAERSQGSS